MRERKAAKEAATQPGFDAAVAAEAKRLNITVATSAKFASAVGPGLKKQGLEAGRDGNYHAPAGFPQDNAPASFSLKSRRGPSSRRPPQCRERGRP
jgi:hypothetical protein